MWPPTATRSPTASCRSEGSAREWRPASGRHSTLKTNDRAEHRYAAVSPEKAHGATYTPTLLADFVAKQLAAAVHAQRDAVLRILDPAVGDAVLLASLVRALRARGLSRICVHGFDTNPVALAEAATRFAREFPDLTPTLEQRDFLDDQPDAQRFDAVIANPPYVRTQVLGAPRAQQLARRYGLTGRVDLYYAFLLAISRVLAPDGTLGIIVSNRFMTTRSGHSVRKALHELYDLLHVWDLGDTRLFDAAVLPAVLLARTANARDPSTRFTSIYETKKTPAENARTAIEALDRHGVVATDDGRRFDVVQGSLDPSGVWRMATVEKDEWLSLVRSRTFARFGDLGKIRVGVPTASSSAMTGTLSQTPFGPKCCAPWLRIISLVAIEHSIPSLRSTSSTRTNLATGAAPPSISLDTRAPALICKPTANGWNGDVT